jgi:hypothetical protein
VRVPMELAWQARAFWTSLDSVFKREWTLDDYAIRVSFLPNIESSHNSRLKPFQWTARIINWPTMSGSANSRAEALAELQKNFDRYKSTRPHLPRPGTKVPIEYAGSGRVDQYPELARDFLERILDIKGAWISDESSLSHFHEQETNEFLIEKIRRVYGADVSDIPGGNLADIFDRIREHGNVPPTPD